MMSEALGFQRDLMNLALLPAEIILEAFTIIYDRLRKNLQLHKIMGSFFDYCERQWLNKVGPNKFSVYRETRRTNNALERYHRTLKSQTATNPELVKFLSKFQQITKSFSKHKHVYVYSIDCVIILLGVLKKMQEDEHAKLLIMDHGKSPHRAKDGKGKRRDKAIKEAWEYVNNISQYETDARKRQISAFFQHLSPHATFLSGKLSSLE